MKPKIYIGMDGGGSKTAGVAIDATGRLLATGRTRGTAIVGVPSPRPGGRLARLFTDLCREAGVAPAAVQGVGLGLSGIDFADEFAMQHEALARILAIPPERLTLVNDGIVALWGAAGKPAAAILQHGSGFTAACRARFGAEQPFDHLDVGRTFDLRNALIAAVARMIDGRRPATALKAHALAHYGVAREADFHELAYRGRLPRESWRTGHQLVYAAWQAGDPMATELVLRAVADYAETAGALIAHTGAEDATMAFGGGVIQAAPEAFLALLADQVHQRHPHAQVQRPALAPADGAALMAAFHGGEDPVAGFHGLLQARKGQQ